MEAACGTEGCALTCLRGDQMCAYRSTAPPSWEGMGVEEMLPMCASNLGFRDVGPWVAQGSVDTQVC